MIRNTISHTTAHTIAKMGKDENISMETLEKICEYVNCDVGDVIEYRWKNEEEIKWDLLVVKRWLYHIY